MTMTPEKRFDMHIWAYAWIRILQQDNLDHDAIMLEVEVGHTSDGVVAVITDRRATATVMLEAR